MKKILILLLLTIGLTTYSQITLRKGFVSMQNNDTVWLNYNSGVWTLESDTTFNIKDVDTLFYADGTYNTTSSSSVGIDSIYVVGHGWITDTIQKADSSTQTYTTVKSITDTAQASIINIDATGGGYHTIKDNEGGSLSLVRKGSDDYIQIGDDEGDAITMYSAEEIEIRANTNIYNFSDSAYAPNNKAIFKNFFARVGGFFGQLLEVDTAKVEALIIAGSEPITGTSTSKYVMENTLTDSVTVGVLIADSIRIPYYIGQLYTDDGSVTVSTTPIDTYQTITGLTSDITENTILTDSSITIVTGGAGYYIPYAGNSYTHGTNSTIVHVSLHVNDMEQTTNEAQRKIGTGGDYGDAGRSSIIWLDEGDVVKWKLKADNTGTATINHGTYYISKLP